MGGTPVEGPFHKKCEGLLPPGSAVVQRRTNSRRESRALQFLRISKEMLENLVNIGIKNQKFIPQLGIPKGYLEGSYTVTS